MLDLKDTPLFQRSIPLLGEDGIRRLRQAKVAIFGLGGVGSYTAEALTRSGIGQLHLVDKDVVEASNLNRQLCALHSTIGQAKVKVVQQRIQDINPEAQVFCHVLCYGPEIGLSFLPPDLDFIVDAIDDLRAKVDLICQAQKAQIPIISALGCGNKLDPTRFQICDLYQTENDPLARALRGRLRKAGVKSLDVVYSPEKPAFKDPLTISSLAYVPAIAGLYCAAHVVQAISQVKCPGASEERQAGQEGLSKSPKGQGG